MSTETLFGMPATGTTIAKRLPVVAPPLKWPGGKSGELDQVMHAAPPSYDRYFEPFVGGGAVYWSVPARVPAWINDTSTDLMGLYRYAQATDDELFLYLEGIVDWWNGLLEFIERYGQPLVSLFQASRDLALDELRPLAAHTVASLLQQATVCLPTVWDDLASDFKQNVLKLVPNKIGRMRTVEEQRGQLLPEEDVWANIEGAYKACAYTALRSAYNVARLTGQRSPRQVALFFYLREFAYAAMFRFNGSGEFNVPYGGITYNRKDFASKIERLRSPEVLARLQNTTIGCEDFESFLGAHQPDSTSWLLADPPYDSDFSTYDERHFTLADQRRLRDVLASLDSSVQLVIKATPAILKLYPVDRWNVMAFDKKYMWTIKQRNDRNATHLMITNYDASILTGPDRLE